MDIEQATFTSAQTTRAQGYHLVARSPGISDTLAQQLALWAPTHNALLDRDFDAESLNYFPVDDEWVALTRTVYGGAEYSDRGGFRLETNILTMRAADLAAYHYHPLAIAKAALASGYLRLRSRLPSELPALSLPTVLGKPPSATCDDEAIRSVVNQIITLEDSQRLVIVGPLDPVDVLLQVFERLPAERRLAMSFSTGLKPTVHRPFRLQFLHEVSGDLARELEARGMKCLTL